MNQASLKAPKDILDYFLIGFSVIWLILLLLLPVLHILEMAFSSGLKAYLKAITDPETVSALRLSLVVALIAVPFNAVFGLSAAWAIARFDFWGKSLMNALLDLPFSLSPVISGLVWVLMFGAQGYFAKGLASQDIEIIFALPGLVLATVLVTLPFVARELIALMEDQGSDEEVAAITLGASSLDLFFRVTLPNIRWALIYGVLLSTARALGEFGAVSVVSGHIQGLTNTLPLNIEVAYNDYNTIGAFGAATLLMGLSLVALVLKSLLEWRFSHQISTHHRH